MKPYPNTAKALAEWHAEAMRELQPDAARDHGFGRVEPLEAWLLANGAESFDHAPRPADVEQGTPQECYRNAFLLAISRDDLTYVEGIVVHGRLPMPIHHAWTIDLDDNVVDPTIEDDDLTYFGVRVPDEVAAEVIVEAGFYGILDKRAGTDAIEALAAE